jgi:probable F420-dependent oxidoreductase
LKAGGHDALDPLVALSFCAAATERLRLIPNIYVLPYRNPFLTAKAVATLDTLSGGRFTLAVATGYLRGEYRALGVDFDERNALFDEALEVIRSVWTTDDYSFAGRSFEAKGQSVNPKPVPRPPIWIGGNSRLSRRRVAQVADGWSPFPAPRQLAETAKTPPLETVEDLAAMLDELWEQVDAAGRQPSDIDVSFSTPDGRSIADPDFDADAHLEGLAELARIGVTWAPVQIPGDDVAHTLDVIARYGELVISRVEQLPAVAR